jgi:dipeptidyl aminopeptidase/acylaminoacyl peptidase
VTREGIAEEIDLGWTEQFGSLALSPDARQLAVTVTQAQGPQVWIKPLEGGLQSRLTFEGANEAPAWTPDGQEVAFVSIRGGERDLYAKPADGSGIAQVLLDEERPIGEAVYSRDGQWLVYRVGAGGGRDIFAMRLDGNSSSVELIASQFEERSPALSPDGKWLAYVSNEQGRSEVFVRPFLDAGAVKWQVSTAGGWEPLWANNGRELFYRSSADEFVAVEVGVEPSFAVRRQRTLFSTEDYLSGYDVSPDDQRFVMVQFVMVQFVGETAETGEMIVVENFFEELREE